VDKKALFDFLKGYGLCVLSTASKTGISESAVMAITFKMDGERLKLLFNTEPTTRKFVNLKENNQVSVVVGGWKDDPSVQIDGTIRILEDKEGKAAKEYILSIHPDWKDYFSSPTGKFFEMTTTWARYNDFSKNPPEVVEIKA